MTDRITIRRPDDWHLHLRDDAMLQAVLPPTARVFGRAIVMPNLKPPVTTSAMAAAYRQRILDALPEGSSFTPLMTLYLTDRTDPADLVAGARDGVVTAVKLYPAGATTNSDSGVSSFERWTRCSAPWRVPAFRYWSTARSPTLTWTSSTARPVFWTRCWAP